MFDPSMPFVRYVKFALVTGSVLGVLGCLLPWSSVTLALADGTIEESTAGFAQGSFLFLPGLVTMAVLGVLGLIGRYDKTLALATIGAGGVTLLLLVQAMLAIGHTTDAVATVLTNLGKSPALLSEKIDHSASFGFYLTAIGSILAMVAGAALFFFHGNKRASTPTKLTEGEGV